jgi:hypothetical protein
MVSDRPCLVGEAGRDRHSNNDLTLPLNVDKNEMKP